MTEAENILNECDRLGILLTLGERSTELAFDAPAGAFTADLRTRVVAHKPDIIEILFEREERAALADAPEWADASMWARAMNNPAVRALMDVGLIYEIVSVQPILREK
jgi:hypothetical protein